MDGGHDAVDHCDADLKSGLTDDPDWSVVVVYVVDTKAAADTAFNYSLYSYFRPC